MKKCVVLSLVLIFVLSLSSSFALAKEPVTVEFWQPWGGSTAAVWEEIVENFMAENPEIKVKMVVVPGELIIQKLTAAIAGGNPPEVAAAYGTWNAIGMIGMGALLPIESFIEEDPTLTKEDFYPGAWNTFWYEDHLWGFPLGMAAVWLIYNENVFLEAGLDVNKPPKYFDEAKEYAIKMSKKGARGEIEKIGYIPWDIWGGFMNFQGLWGGSLYDSETKKITADFPQNLKALQYWIDFAKEVGAAEAVTAFQEKGGTATTAGYPFFIDKVGMKLEHLCTLPRLAHLYAPELKWKAAPPLVAREATTYPKAPHAVSDSIFMPLGSKNPEEGYTLFKYLAAGEGSLVWSNLVMLHTIRPELDKIIDWPEWLREEHPEAIELATEVLLTARSLPTIPVMNLYQDRLVAETEKAIRGLQTAEEALEKVRVMVQKELDRVL